MKKTYRLPDGKTTTSPKMMAEKWKEIYSTLEQELGLRCIGFDPGYVFVPSDSNSKYHPALYLPSWFVLKLVEYLKHMSMYRLDKE